MDNNFWNLMTRILAEEATTEEIKRFDAIITSDEKARIMFCQAKTIWNPNQSPSNPFDVKVAFKNITNKLSK